MNQIPYTDLQLSGDDPLYQEDVTGSHSLVIRVTADAMDGEVQYSVMEHGVGALDSVQMMAVVGAIQQCVKAGDRYRRWYARQVAKGAAA